MTAGEKLLKALLPDSLAEIVEAIGFEATLALVERFGGIPIYLPKDAERIKIDHPLARLLGLDAARRLARARPYELLHVPRATRYLREIRNLALRRDYSEASASAVARKYGLTRRQVFRVAAADVPPQLQGDLFGKIAD